MDSIKISFRDYIFPNIHREGIPFVIAAFALTVVAFLFSNMVGWIFLLLSLFVFYFFRDPERVTSPEPGIVVSPADGVVQMIGDVVPPKELGLGSTMLTRVSIFMSVFDVHVNRVPVSGRIDKIVYVPGKFSNVMDEKESSSNERNIIKITTESGEEMSFVQVAGLVARRIVCDVREGADVKTGERFGMIRFGSRLDVYLPKGVSPTVFTGQKAVAGETIIARLG